MSLKTFIKGKILHLLHADVVPTVANISYLQASKKLEGKKIIITGGGRGLGFSMAKKFVSEGADVLIAGRSEKTLKSSAEELGCNFLALDVQNIDTFQSFIDEADKILGGVNCLVNNAGISLHEDGFLNVTPNQFDSQFNTNLKGPFFLTQCFIRKCRENNITATKNILFTSSETSTTVDERPYGLTKIALNSLLQGLAYRFKEENYRINAVAPGVTISDMIGETVGDNLGCGKNRYFLPEEVAEVASFLISDISNCMTGQIVICNEGKTINARWK